MTVSLATGCNGVHGLDSGAASRAEEQLTHPRLSTTPAQQDSLRSALRAILVTGGEEEARLRSYAQTHQWYQKRDHAPTWAGRGELDEAAIAVGAALRSAAAMGLDSQDYGPDALAVAYAALQAAPGSVRAYAMLDVQLTDFFLALVTDVAHGRAVPANLHEGWGAPPRAIDPFALLSRAVREHDLVAALDMAQPQELAYTLLVAALQRYRQMDTQGGWPALPTAARLAAGDTGIDVAALHARLAAEGFVDGIDSGTFNDALKAAVQRFQRARGLEPDGIVGPKTRRALRTPPRELAERIVLNLERLRWEDRSVHPFHIEVLIPAFELRLFDGGVARVDMRVIAGRPDWPTPIFDALATHAIFSPYWNVPPGIVSREVLPAMRRDPRYLQRHELRVVTAAGRVVDASTIDWNAVRAATFPYRFRQDPGPRNPLGGVKFLLPNPYHVFLHDTPGRAAFQAEDRALSHGCIRVEHAALLAEHLLAGADGWGDAEIQRAMRAGTERTIALPRRIPIMVRYQTAWVSSDGATHFREDIYGHDRRLRSALAQSRPERIASTNGGGRSDSGGDDLERVPSEH